MEKLMFLAQLPKLVDADDYRDKCMDTLAEEILTQSVDIERLEILVEDSDVKPAAHWRLEHSPPAPQIVVSARVSHANRYQQMLPLLSGSGLTKIETYLVSESEALKNSKRSPGRSEGSLQLCTFSAIKGPDLPEFIQRWRGDHTDVALATQCNLAYRQNLVVAALTPNVRGPSAIVEEQFPARAMYSAEELFNAKGDPEELDRRRKIMAESCQRFLDFSTINVVHMSEYVYR